MNISKNTYLACGYLLAIAVAWWVGSAQQATLLGFYLVVMGASVMGELAWLHRVDTADLSDDDKIQNKDAVVVLSKSVMLLATAGYIAVAGAVACFPNNSNALGLAAIWTLCGSGVGGSLGFLFGHPKIEENDGGSDTSADAGQKRGKRRLRSNTGLDQINEWLTKALVGVGLVEAQRIAKYMSQLATKLGEGMAATGSGGSVASGFAVAAALITVFPLLGFVSGYLVTRTFVALALCRADAAGISAINPTAKLGLTVFQLKDAAATGRNVGATQQNPSIPDSVSGKLATLKMGDLRNATEYSAWAKSQMKFGNTFAAQRALSKAVEIEPQDPGIVLDYALTLRQTSQEQCMEQLKVAYQLISSTTPPELKEQIYNALMFSYLYRTAEKGYNEVIKLGKEYSAGANNAPSGGIFVNLACAYGQLAATLDKTSAEWAAARDGALNAIEGALSLDSVWKSRLQLLWDPNHPDKKNSPEENDLEVFAEEAAFKNLLR